MYHLLGQKRPSSGHKKRSTKQMAVGLTKALTEDTTTILSSTYEDLIRQSEQLRILKNCINKDMLLCDIKNVINAMDEQEKIEIIADGRAIINALKEDPNNEEN